MLFDTHAHYYDARFDEDRDEILSSLKENGVEYVLNAGCSLESTQKCIDLSEKYDFSYAAAGFHPNYTAKLTNDDFDRIKAFANHKKVKAIGEIGLDFHYDYSPKDAQREAFARQIDIAQELEMPFIVHDREATGACIDVLRAECKKGGSIGVMHCFGESVETAKILLDLGFYMGFGGTLTFKNNVRAVEAAKYIPIERIVLETDCPYLAPTPYRGKRNSSLYLHLVAEKLAEIKGISVDEVARITTENAKKLFNL